MNHDSYPDSYIRGILNTVKTIAMVGASEKENRPSYFAFKYLLERGYTMIPVNPGHAGEQMLGQRIYARLADIPVPVDMVDIFRASQYVLPVVQEALALTPRPQVIWMQLGVRSDAGGSQRHEGGDESLPEDRIRPALFGNRLDGRQHPHHQLEERDHRWRPAHVAQSHHRARRRHRSRRPCSAQRKPLTLSFCAASSFRNGAPLPNRNT
jgi:predicted CoA-binding protein